MKVRAPQCEHHDRPQTPWARKDGEVVRWGCNHCVAEARMLKKLIGAVKIETLRMLEDARARGDLEPGDEEDLIALKRELLEKTDLGKASPSVLRRLLIDWRKHVIRPSPCGELVADMESDPPIWVTCGLPRAWAGRAASGKRRARCQNCGDRIVTASEEAAMDKSQEESAEAMYVEADENIRRREEDERADFKRTRGV